MPFWKIFSQNQEQNPGPTGQARPADPKTLASSLQQQLGDKLPTQDPHQVLRISCLAGLLAKVAYADYEVHAKEREEIVQALTQATSLTPPEIQCVTAIALEEIQELAGLEDHLYTHHLDGVMSQEENYQILLALFAVAASDGKVSNKESETIRVVAQGLRLSQKHFLAARASVAQALGALG